MSKSFDGFWYEVPISFLDGKVVSVFFGIAGLDRSGIDVYDPGARMATNQSSNLDSFYPCLSGNAYSKSSILPHRRMTKRVPSRASLFGKQCAPSTSTYLLHYALPFGSSWLFWRCATATSTCLTRQCDEIFAMTIKDRLYLIYIYIYLFTIYDMYLIIVNPANSII